MKRPLTKTLGASLFAAALFAITGCGSASDEAAIIPESVVTEQVAEETVEEVVEETSETADQETGESQDNDGDQPGITIHEGVLINIIDGGYLFLGYTNLAYRYIIPHNLTGELIQWGDPNDFPYHPEGRLGNQQVGVFCGALLSYGELEGDVLATGGPGVARIDPGTGEVMWTGEWEPGENRTCFREGYMWIYVRTGMAGYHSLVSLETGDLVLTVTGDIYLDDEGQVASLSGGQGGQVYDSRGDLTSEQQVELLDRYSFAFLPETLTNDVVRYTRLELPSPLGWLGCLDDGRCLRSVPETGYLVLLDAEENVLDSWSWEDLESIFRATAYEPIETDVEGLNFQTFSWYSFALTNDGIVISGIFEDSPYDPRYSYEGTLFIPFNNDETE